MTASLHDLRGLARGARKRATRAKVRSYREYCARFRIYDEAQYRLDLAECRTKFGDLTAWLKEARDSLAGEQTFQKRGARAVLEQLTKTVSVCPVCFSEDVSKAPATDLAPYTGDLATPAPVHAFSCNRCACQYTCAHADLFIAALEGPPWNELT